MYTLSGTARIGSNTIAAHTTVVLANDADQVKVESSSTDGARFVLIAGQPIKEPIVQHGPFVMNTQEEIYATFMDYQMGKNGFEKAHNWKSTIGNR